MSNAPNFGLPMVYLVDDEEEMREALGWLLTSRRLQWEGFPSAEAFESMVDTRATLFGGTVETWPRSPSCVVLDVRMGGMSGMELFDRLLERGLTKRLPVIFLTGHGDLASAVTAVKRGAFDYAEKPHSDNRLLDIIDQALKASASSLVELSNEQAKWNRLSTLTDREREVVQHVARGFTNKDIGAQLKISVRTVEVHRARAFVKLCVSTAVDLAVYLKGRNASDPFELLDPRVRN